MATNKSFRIGKQFRHRATFLLVLLIVLFVSDEGKIHKIVQWTRNGDSQSALLDIFDVTPGEPIQVNWQCFVQSDFDN